MVCEKRPYLCAILVLCCFALFFHLVGYVAPGWLIMKRSVGDVSLFQMKGQRIDDGGVTPPAPMPEDDEPRAMFRKRRSDDDDDSTLDEDESREHHDGHHGGHGSHGGHHGPPHGGHHGPHHGHDGPHGGHGRHHEESEFSDDDDDDFRKGDRDMIKEQMNVESWMMKAVSEIETFDVRTSYGLWYSVMCIREKRMGDDNDSDEKHMEMMDDDSSSSSDDDDDKKGRCRCKKMSTKCALSYAAIYEDFMFAPRHDKRLSYSNFGNASLKEHQIENTVVLACMVLGLIAAIAGFKNANGCRCSRVACVVFMLLAAFIAIVPVARLGHYSVSRCHQKSMHTKVHAPYSAIATLIGAIFAFITALVAGYALFKTRRNQAGKWYQFNNEMETSNDEKKEKPALFFSTDPLPMKPGLYDVCDFSDIKPVEEIKKPERKEEESDEFVL